MRLLPSTDEIHSCEKIYGKAVHIATGEYGDFYCGYCLKPLLITQLNKRWDKLLKNRKGG